MKTKALLLNRYATVLLLNPAMGGLLLCSLLVVIGTVLLWPKAVRREFARGKPVSPSAAVPAVHAAVAPVAVHTVTPKAMRAQHPAVFESATMNPLLQPVDRFAGLPAKELMRHISVRDFIASTVPYTPFHYGVDHPLPGLMISLFTDSQVPVEVREGRYLLMTHTNAPEGGRGREFFWADTRDGVGIGGIFFYPSNGEPSPTLTLFSRQVKSREVGIGQMPAEFLRELTAWEAHWNVPPVTVRYFINAQGEKSVLARHEDLCGAAPADVCKKTKADAAVVDHDASYFLSQTHHASNATAHMIGNTE